MIFPNLNKNNLKEKNKDFEIISNNTDVVSAVKNKKLNIVEYVFWKSGQLDNIIVDNPCILIIINDYLYVSETTHKLDYITISIRIEHYQAIRVYKGYTTQIKINK